MDVQSITVPGISDRQAFLDNYMQLRDMRMPAGQAVMQALQVEAGQIIATLGGIVEQMAAGQLSAATGVDHAAQLTARWNQHIDEAVAIMRAR